MARVRMPRLCRRGTPSRALPAAPRRRETASRGAHRLRKARDPRSRASVVFQPRTSADARFPRSTPPRAQARRARVRPPTGQRRRIHRGASSENARSPRAPTRAPSRRDVFQERKKTLVATFSRVVVYPSSYIPPIDRTLIHAVTPPRFHRASTRRSTARSWTVSGCAWRLCACSPAAARAAAAKPPTPTPGSGARGAAPWAASAPARAALSPRSSASGRRSRRTCRRGGGPRRSTGARRRM